MTEGKKVIFREEQRLGPGWLRVTMLCVLLVVLFAWVFPLCQSVYRGLRGGEIYWPFVGPQIVLSTICVALLLFLYSPKLVIEVRADGLYVRFFPLHLSFRRIPLANVTRCEAVTYRPVRDYGGWGIKGGRGCRAYTASGNRGVRIDYADGSHLLIGSQRPDELAQAVHRLLE